VYTVIRNKILKVRTVMIRFLVFMIFMAIILALWEIQIEGKDGWAAKAPCWRIEKGLVYKLMGERPLTGYHFYMTLFMIAIVHLPVLFISWSWKVECLLIAFYFGMIVVEDFLWFVFNPHYGIKNFRKGKIWWHKTWWGPVPDFYWVEGVVVVLLLYLGRTAI